MNTIIRCFGLLFFGTSIVNAQGDCFLRNGGIGKCVPANECEDSIVIDKRFGEEALQPTKCVGNKICCSNVAALLVQQACNEFVREKRGEKKDITPQILNGVDVMDGEFPHMAALGYMRDTGLMFDCGGTLISDRYVLTASHCIHNQYDTPPSLVRLGTVILNSTDIDPAITDYEIEKIIDHPRYDRLKRLNDISLLRLKKQVKFSGTIFPACINTDKSDPKEDTLLFVSGWGVTNTSTLAVSNIMQKANLTFVKTEACNELHNTTVKFQKSNPNGLLKSQMCANSNISDTCQGDSGGPIKVPHQNGVYRVIGLTSFGKKCGGIAPGIYTKVSSYLKFISDEVWPNRKYNKK